MVASNTLASRQTDLGTEIKGQIAAAAERMTVKREFLSMFCLPGRNGGTQQVKANGTQTTSVK